MTIRSPYIIAKPAPKATREAVVNLYEVGRLVEDLKALKERTQAEHEAAQSKRDAEHQASLARIEATIHAAHAHVQTIKKGDKGDAVKGDKGEAPSLEKIIEAILPHMPQPKKGDKGEDAIVNEEAIAQKVLKKVKIPPPEKPKEVDLAKVTDLIIEKIKNEKLLTPEHVKGFREEMTSYRAQLAGKHYGQNTGVRGGGDTVKAGTNTTITRNSDGTVSVNASASGGTGFQTPTGTVNGSNKVFVFTNAPSAVVVDGGRAIQKTSSDGTVNWTGTTTITLSVAPNFDIFGIA